MSFDPAFNEKQLADLEKGQAITLEGRIVPRTRMHEGKRLYEQTLEITRVQRGAKAKASERNSSAQPAEQAA